MILRTAIILLLATTLSACGHFRAPKTQSTIAVEQTTGEAQETSVTGEGPDKFEQTNDQATIYEHSVAEIVAPSIVAEIDLLERIRNGFTFPEFNSKRTKRYEKWNSQHPSYLENLFERAQPFLFYIVEEIEKRGLPTEIALLPAIESAYKPNAISRSKAGGLWQFIPSTAKHFGLQQNWWYDGRRDLIASTNAALDYLVQLNNMFEGDWYNTLAAYNAGPGTLQRAIKANQRKRRSTDYQSLKLRKETVNYVPKLIALKNIINDPAQYGVSLPHIPNKAAVSVLTLPGQIDLHNFAAETNIELATLQHLNAGFRRWASSPDGPHRLLVPASQLQISRSVVAQMASEPKINYQNHNIRRGDTLSGIARKYRVSVGSLKSVNKLSNSSIREGRNLLIPVASKTAGDLSNSGSSVAALNSSNNKFSTHSKRLHTVVAGDTLWSIARRYQVKVAELVSWNRLSKPQILSLDQVLQIVPN